MSDTNDQKDFFNRADEIIAVVNKQAKEAGIAQASISLLFAAARFNAFNVASASQSAEVMENDRERAFQHFTEKYANMLEENLDEYIKNFSRYMKK